MYQFAESLCENVQVKLEPEYSYTPPNVDFIVHGMGTQYIELVVMSWIEAMQKVEPTVNKSM